MRFRTLEIRWHDSKPISSCDFQPVPVKKARPPAGDLRAFGAQAYRLATAGEDNHVRVWMVHPHIQPPGLGGDPAPARPARVEYLATLSRHSAAVNVVRFSPNGEFLASAGDDGMVIIWAPSATPQTSTYGSDLSAEDLQHEKEYWKPRTTFRCTTMQVYDLAWSPTGEFILAGSTDNAARVFAAADGKCVHEIAEHSHYVQGVAWDPLNEYIATQSSDRSMHVYRISTSKGTFEAHAVGRNTRFPTHTSRTHSRTPSVPHDDIIAGASDWNRPRMMRSVSIESDRERDTPGTPFPSTPASLMPATPASLATPAAGSVGSLPATGGAGGSGGSGAAMFPPPPAGPSSRRSSFSGSNAPSSPSGFSAVSGFSRAYGRSPSPMPALPAIRTPPSSAAGWAGRYEEHSRERGRGHYDERRHTDGSRMYGDEGFSNFFRRLAFSPDGGLLLTPAGTFEDPSATVPGWEGSEGWQSSGMSGEGKTPMETKSADEGAARGRKARPVILTGSVATTGLGMGTDTQVTRGTASTVFIYSRANFARPPVAQLPGHKKASVAVRFNPVLFELRPGVAGGGSVEPTTGQGSATGDGETGRDVEESLEVDLVGPLAPAAPSTSTQIAAPAPQHGAFNVLASPAPAALSPTDRRPPTPVASKPSTPGLGHIHTPVAAPGTGSVFTLPYRMLYAVVTMDTVAIYDTQQAGPVCLLTNLHYDEFTDITWSPDGQCVLFSSRDGYCTLVTFDEILPPHHTQQAALQLQQIAAQHSVPISYAPSGSGGATPRKRPLEPLTPAASVDGDRELMPASMPASTSSASIASEASAADSSAVAGEGCADGPPKKKRRVALTRVGDL
ncbi:WD40-repeat-containing domain protein [Mycena pura]|uniref:WD40-repeat-containing domain protein n=1 Tax=Mycena pura TaxID=153505 RepID=A0AAD6VGX5_9AGAR|nr:WD40-repeat-containing domain protein [Mycena pura]